MDKAKRRERSLQVVMWGGEGSIVMLRARNCPVHLGDMYECAKAERGRIRMGGV